MKDLPSIPDDPAYDTPGMVPLCSECQNGVLQLRHITYFTWLNEELITVPNFPAWVCDVCGRREYDSRAIVWINTLLNPEARRRSGRRQGPRPGGNTHRATNTGQSQEA